MRKVLMMLMVMAGCDVAVEPGPAPQPLPARAQSSGPTLSTSAAISAFSAASRQVEPVAESLCAQRTRGMNCDFQIRLDRDPKLPPNAYQSLDKQGRPTITFTHAMMSSFRNTDEIAFVMSHEAAHHIRGHLQRGARDATVGALVLAGVAAAAGASTSTILDAQQLGAVVGSRSYSKNYELEADELGTIITARSGYRPRKGVEYFYRLPDPGDRFLGSHPPNSDRITVVQRTIQANGLN